MDKINIGDINFSKLSKMPLQGSQSTVYDAGDICIKIFDHMPKEERVIMMKKLQEMDGITIDGVLFPIDLIVENGLVRGYTMAKFQNSLPMFDYFGSVEYANSKNILAAIERATKILKQLHEHKIIVQDFSFDNILINRQEQIMFADYDSFKFKNYTSPYYSLLLTEFTMGYRHEELEYTYNSDKLSLILATFQLLFLNEIQRVSKRQYNRLSKKIHTLENMRECSKRILDLSSDIKELPYVDEFLDLSDDYVIDRVKQLPLKARMMYKVLK